ncbi:MAG: efflux RND transporter permease subunit, partial [Candidatus Competibacteraceae bacterium]|nr:efflux RND transporter permease subunit [Candidatus Competibacteraceae bacterium]
VSTFGQGPPYAAPVAFRIVGPQLVQLKQYGEELRRIMHTEPAILHTQASIAGGDPKLWFAADEYQARLAGLTLQEIAGQFQTALEGRSGGSVLEDLEELPVRIRYSEEQRASLDDIGSLKLVAAGSGGPSAWVPAVALGDLNLRPEPGSLTRRNGERVNIILGYVAQGTLPLEVTQNIMAKLAAEGFELEPGYRLEVAGGSEEQGRAIAQLMTYVPVLVALMIATLVLSFRSVLLAGVIAAVALLSVGLGMLHCG